jgi:uncharacterized protein YkwD
MKFIHIVTLFTAIVLISACSRQENGAPVQGASGLTQTAMQPMVTPEPATATRPADSHPTATPLPATAQATQPVTTAPVGSPTPTALQATEAPTAQATVLTLPTTVPPTAPPPTATPGAQVADGSGGCTDIATYSADVTVPDGTSFRKGDTFVKTWRIRNVGTCDWDSGYSLVFAGGDAMSAPLSNPLPKIPQGSQADVSVNLTAPERGGSYQSNWEFQSPDGSRFGVGMPASGLLWAQINVSFVEATPAAPSDSSTSPSTPQKTQGACPVKHDAAVDAQVLALINQARTNEGLNPLAAQDQLAAAALAHSTDMACNDLVSHVGSDGTLWYNRVAAQGYANYNSSRENIYVGHPEFGGTAQGAFDWWWDSKIHHDNMLNPDVSQIGIAYVYDPNSEYGGYYTTVFARP